MTPLDPASIRLSVAPMMDWIVCRGIPFYINSLR